MSKSGVIVIVEDDSDDRMFLREIFRELEVPNELKWFETAESAMEYISTTFRSLFLIISDINLPGRSGLDFKRDIDADPILRRKSIPFLFYSTTTNQEEINDAYIHMTIQGFFKKGPDYNDAKNAIRIILEYWKLCRHPNTQ